MFVFYVSGQVPYTGAASRVKNVPANLFVGQRRRGEFLHTKLMFRSMLARTELGNQQFVAGSFTVYNCDHRDYVGNGRFT